MSSSDDGRALVLTRRSLLQLAAATVVATPYAAHAQAADLRPLVPVDQSSRDKSLQAMLGNLRAIVKRKDGKGLMALMDANFKVEFDVGKGPAVFKTQWKPEAPTSPVWPVLDRLLSLGGTFYSDSLFCLPYVYTRFPIDLDRLSYVVATGEVPFHAESNKTAARVGVLKHSIIPLATPLTPPAQLTQVPFVAVRHPEKGVVYVAGSDVYSPAGHRLFFEKRQGQWRWLSLAAPTLATPPILLKSEA